MKKLIILLLTIVLTSCTDIVYTSGHSKNIEDYNYKVSEIKPYFKSNKALYNLDMQDNKGEDVEIIGQFDRIQIVDSVGAFNIGDIVELKPIKIK